MRRWARTITLTSALMLVAAFTAFPLVWMVFRSLQPDGPSPHDEGLSLAHYARFLRQQPAALWLSNSLLLASAQTLIACFTSSLAGYVLAHHRFRFRGVLTAGLMLTLLLPSQVTLPASWLVIYRLDLMNSYFGLILPAGANIVGVLLFRHAAAQVPQEIIDAARIDAASEWRIWWDIILPMIQPTLATFAVLSFVANWNAYLWPLIVLQDDAKYTLAMGLANMAGMPQERELGLMLAATSLSVVPALLLFLAARRSLQEAFSEGSDR